MTPNGKSPVMTIGQLASYLQLNVTTVYKMAREGRVPGFKTNVRGDWRFNIEDIDRWRLEQSKVTR